MPCKVFHGRDNRRKKLIVSTWSVQRRVETVFPIHISSILSHTVLALEVGRGGWGGWRCIPVRVDNRDHAAANHRNELLQIRAATREVSTALVLDISSSSGNFFVVIAYVTRPVEPHLGGCYYRSGIVDRITLCKVYKGNLQPILYL